MNVGIFLPFVRRGKLKFPPKGLFRSSTILTSANDFSVSSINRYASLNYARIKVPEDDSLKHPDFFGVEKLVSVKDLFDARVHYGHKKGSRSEHMKPYLFGCRLDVDIIDLDQTLPHFHKALNFLAHIAYRGGIILFLTKSQQFAPIIEQLAIDCGEYAHTRPWMEGTFTNVTDQWKNVRFPDVCVFLSIQGAPYETHNAVAEATKLGIITVGVCDSNVNPTLISYPIPGNDDTPSAIELYCRLFKKAILLGKEKRKLLEI